MEIRLNTLKVLLVYVEMHLLNWPSSNLKMRKVVAQVYVNDSLPVAIGESSTKVCLKGGDKLVIPVILPKVYTAGTFDVYVGLQKYRERLKVHHEGKVSDAM